MWSRPSWPWPPKSRRGWALGPRPEAERSPTWSWLQALLLSFLQEDAAETRSATPSLYSAGPLPSSTVSPTTADRTAKARFMCVRTRWSLYCTYCSRSTKTNRIIFLVLLSCCWLIRLIGDDSTDAPSQTGQRLSFGPVNTASWEHCVHVRVGMCVCVFIPAAGLVNQSGSLRFLFLSSLSVMVSCLAVIFFIFFLSTCLSLSPSEGLFNFFHTNFCSSSSQLF